MKIFEQASLKDYHTFHVQVYAKRIIWIESIQDVNDYFNHPSSNWIILGSGSNILFQEDFDGDVLVLKFEGIELLKKENDFIFLEVLAGTNWHSFVSQCVDNNYSGVENLALIPGTVGAAPIQNIGAYGVELNTVLENVTFFDIKSKSFITIKHDDCEFEYRNSIFKKSFKNQVCIVKVQFKLRYINHQLNISYKPVSDLMAQKNISEPTIKDVFDSVVEIRQSKLPDPNKIGNAGSFFKNPIISKAELTRLQKTNSDIPYFNLSDLDVKIPAGWLIEKSEWKGFRDGDLGVYPKQALVLVNYGNAKGNEIKQLSQKIIQSVYNNFNIELETEVNII